MTGFEICPSCGAAVLPGERRCPRCGATGDPPRLSARAGTASRAARVALFGLLGLAAVAAALAFLGRDRSRGVVASISRQVPGVMTLVTYDHRNREISQGSGFLLSRDGLAASNFHVLRDAYRAEVTLGDGRLYHVLRVHGFNPGSDLVVFQIGRTKAGRIERPTGLHPLTLGASGGLQVGDRIATISSPKGLANTVSDGLVSAIRDDEGERLIQISAPISPGSSGGPVFDASGKVVGIATLQMTQGQNLNFATPIDSLKEILGRRENLTLGEFQQRAKAATGDDDDFNRSFAAALRHQNRGEYRKAVQGYLYAEVLDPDEASSYYNAGLCYVEMRERERAAEQFYRYLATAPDDDEDRADIEDWLTDNGYRVPKQ